MHHTQTTRGISGIIWVQNIYDRLIYYDFEEYPLPVLCHIRDIDA